MEGRGGAPGTVPLQNPQVTSRKACLRNAEKTLFPKTRIYLSIGPQEMPREYFRRTFQNHAMLSLSPRASGAEKGKPA